MAGRKNVLFRMGSHDPEPVVVSAKSMETGALGHVPDPNGFIFRVGQNQILRRMKKNTRHIIEMAPQSIHLPALGVVHPPQLDCPVLEREREREGEREEERERERVRRVDREPKKEHKERERREEEERKKRESGTIVERIEKEERRRERRRRKGFTSAAETRSWRVG